MAEPIPKRHRSGSGYRGLRDSEISSLAAPFYGLGHGHGLGLVKKVGASGLRAEHRGERFIRAVAGGDADPSQVYRVGGDGIVGSSTFHLSAGSHTVSADTGSTLKRGFGWAFTVTGGLALFAGLVVLAVTPRTLSDCTSGVCTDKDQSAAIYGLTLPIIGAGAVVLGLGLWMVLSSKTHVTVDGGAADDARLRLGPFQLSERGLAF